MKFKLAQKTILGLFLFTGSASVSAAACNAQISDVVMKGNGEVQLNYTNSAGSKNSIICDLDEVTLNNIKN